MVRAMSVIRKFLQVIGNSANAPFRSRLYKFETLSHPLLGWVPIQTRYLNGRLLPQRQSLWTRKYSTGITDWILKQRQQLQKRLLVLGAYPALPGQLKVLGKFVAMFSKLSKTYGCLIAPVSVYCPARLLCLTGFVLITTSCATNTSSPLTEASKACFSGTLVSFETKSTEGYTKVVCEEDKGGKANSD
jgi:hypothetical protein